ncbi:MAG: heavy-metal-associated domain-containing protein, partial [Pseudonocardia sp.]|nr:heavy-metal-associated domain-containing protein [Pseudonocardia sp.]
MSTTTTAPAGAVTDIELAISGMTCASCANRIERKLNKLDGVTATVNYATEKAKVTAPDGVDPAALVAQVEAAGYHAALPRPPAEDRDRIELTLGGMTCASCANRIER